MVHFFEVMENEELEKLVTENLRVARQNNELLQKIRRGMIIGRLFSALYWLIILGSALGIYFYLQPYIEGFGDFSEQIKEFLKNPSSIRDTF